jgi:hypothetical protein
MSWRQSKKQTRSYVPSKVVAEAVSKRTRSAHAGGCRAPAGGLDRSAVRVEANDGGRGVCLGEQDRRGSVAAADVRDPTAGGELGLDTVERRNPRRGQVVEVPGRKNRSQPPSTCGSCDPQANPVPVRNRSAMVSVAYTDPTAISNAPMTHAGLFSSVSGSACSSGSENRLSPW